MNLGSIRTFFREARRRKLYTSAAAYLAVSLVVTELGDALFNAVLPGVTIAPRLLTIFLLLGFPVVLVLAWVFDIGPAGLHRTAAVGEAAIPTSRGWLRPRAQAQPRQIEIVEEAPRPERVRRASLGFVRHELRTPINAIIGYSEMLLDDARAEQDAIAVADLERIVRCGRDILSLVNSILDEERISAEQDRELSSYGEQIRADLRDPLGAVTGYTELLIELSQEAGKTARIKDLERVLAAAQKLLELSNDIVALATQAPDAVAVGASRGAALAEGVLSKIREVQTGEAERQGSLLIVDDSATTRDLLAKQLARKGYVVATAENGRAALELLNEQHFDGVLLDVLMPEMDGVEVLRRIKSDAALCDIPVIMISALDEVDSIVRCLEIGAADFVSKPFHPTLLDARIQATLSAQRPRETFTSPEMEKLVGGTFPQYVIDRVAAGETHVLDGAQNAAVLFVDLDQAVAAPDPRERAARMETLIDIARAVSQKHETTLLLQGIGLLIGAGFPQPSADAPERIARTALAFLQESDTRGLRCRCALHLGSLYGAVVGQQTLTYSVWGDAVDLARRMAIGAEKGQIVVSAPCQAALKDHFALSNLGVIEVSGRGQMKAYRLDAEAAVAR